MYTLFSPKIVCPLKSAKKTSEFARLTWAETLCLVVCVRQKRIEPNQQIEEEKKNGAVRVVALYTHSLGASGRFVPADLSEYRGERRRISIETIATTSHVNICYFFVCFPMHSCRPYWVNRCACKGCRTHFLTPPECEMCAELSPQWATRLRFHARTSIRVRLSRDGCSSLFFFWVTVTPCPEDSFVHSLKIAHSFECFGLLHKNFGGVHTRVKTGPFLIASMKKFTKFSQNWKLNFRQITHHRDFALKNWLLANGFFFHLCGTPSEVELTEITITTTSCELCVETFFFNRMNKFILYGGALDLQKYLLYYSIYYYATVCTRVWRSDFFAHG